MTATLRLTLAIATAIGLAGCDRDEKLPGQRLDPLAVTSPDGPGYEGAPGVSSTALSLPAISGNAEWTQRGGNAAHAPVHAAIGQGTSRIWSASIGQGASKSHRITADPVVAGGLAFTLDAQARVTATTLNGGRAWSTDITPVQENPASASGGGLAYEGGRIFATTGFGELVALDAISGAVLWRQRVDNAISGGPAVRDGMVYVASRNSVGWAVRASDGRVMWQTSGSPSTSGVMGVSTPAVSGGTVVFPFASGQLVAVDATSGLTNWTAQIAGQRAGRSIGYIRDVTGDPVIAGGRVYGGTSSGRIDAVDMASGMRDWDADDGASGPVVVAGGSVFAVNDQAELIRLDAATGGVIWRQPMPYFTTERVRRQSGIHAHYGPVLAGGRLFVASSDGVLRIFDPASGALTGQAEIPGGAASAPVVAGQTLYVVGRDGQLHAYR
ncbi:PQQ-binding-like beta-propeller repeat protein [Paracoccus sp. 1_MG-2023]|uniref:outer membrane protein assembly factor BamB family protein n=1 Tax=unclassified Paracoccus (in: a-proteobacteria) TaxID=2688777 RepID=UPI001C096951|nr:MULTISPECIES: PQQ-binding-like beta-propeller repeat protein [unclassified Paracoccus (in: a-proteobacteria)]MBU2957088.1 PQQ-binding-like beta-propeller repeat protein [Paracoccus sp. C2R09]MDO6669578.1 PQQ-binding-like beta-propeller repeat protein [Paracoccus sp. 1_MG-2023]